MGLTKSEMFNANENQMAQLAKALGHPARVAIINHLLKKKSCICKDLVEEIALAQPTISQHLKELKNAGLIKGTIEGNSVCYCLDKEGFTQLVAFGNGVLIALENVADNCC